MARKKIVNKRAGGRPPLPRAVPGGGSTPAERVTWLLETIWNGNRSEMARDVGCSHSVLVKIAAGEQGPGRRLLTAIASHPKVNPAWLLAGEGEPLLAERPDAPTEGWPLPIARQPVPGPPDKYRSLLSGERFPIAGAFYRPSRYWLEVARGEDILRSDAVRVQQGDLLLMETDKSWWKQPQLVARRICVVRVGSGRNVEYKIGLVEYEPRDLDNPEDAPYFGVDFFERAGVDPSKSVQQILINLFPGGKIEVERRRRKHEKDFRGHPVLAPVSESAFGPVTHKLSLGDIVAICVLIIRRC